MEHEITWAVHAAHVQDQIARAIRVAELIAELEQSRGLDATRHLQESHPEQQWHS